MAGKHRNLVHVGRLSQRREIPHLHVLNHALSKWCHHRKLLCEIEFAGISNSIVSQRAFSAKKISDESEITEEWKAVSGRRTTSRSCYYRDSGLVQNALCDTGYTTTRFEIPILPLTPAQFRDAAPRERLRYPHGSGTSRPYQRFYDSALHSQSYSRPTEACE